MSLNLWRTVGAVTKAWPWLTPTIVALRWEETDGAHTGGTANGAVRLRLNYDSVDIAREALHHLVQHYRRGRGLDPDRWWEAARCALEHDLYTAFRCPLSSRGLERLTAEEYYELGDSTGAGAGAGRDCGSDETELDAARQATLARGDTPTWVWRLVPRVAPAQRIRWYHILARALHTELSREGAETRDYSRLHRLQACVGGGIVLGRVTGYKPRVCVAIDTSGSMGEREIAYATARVKEISQSLGADVDVVTGDTCVQWSGKARALQLGGGGGTAFSPIIEWAEQRKYRSLVYITDGYGEHDVYRPTHMQLVWCVTPGGRQPATHGRSIRMEV